MAMSHLLANIEISDVRKDSKGMKDRQVAIHRKQLGVIKTSLMNSSCTHKES